MTSATRWPLILLLAGSIAAAPARSIAQSAPDSTATPAAAPVVTESAAPAATESAESKKDAKQAAKLAKKAAADSAAAKKAAEKAEKKAAARAAREASKSSSMSAADLTAAPMTQDAKQAAKLAKKAAADSAAAKKAAEKAEKKAAARAAKAAGSGAKMPAAGLTATPAPPDAAAANKAAAGDAKAAARAEKKAAKLAAKAARQAQKSGSSTESKPAWLVPGSTIGRVFAPLRERTSDEVIARDLGWIDELKAKLAALTGNPDPWRVAGARLWLDAAREEYLDNDETGFEQAAFAAASALVAALESGAEPVTKETVPAAQLLSGSVRLRSELWDKLENLKRDEGFQCAAPELAMLEVELQWAGHEHVDRGQCASDPHLSLAEQHAMAAQALAAGCRKPEVKPIVETPPAPVVVPVPAPPLQMPTAEELKIPKDVHFALNKSYVGLSSRQVITGVANVLLKYPSVYAHLTGHTDSRGSYEYNLALSQRRVNAVQQVLRELGVDSTRITVDFVGKSELYAPEVSTKGYALNRRVEMAFQDSEGREIKSERTEADLQIEADRPPPPPPTPAPSRRPRMKTTVRPKTTTGVADSVPRLPKKPRMTPSGVGKADSLGGRPR
jgi:outer membrane protein OmpA-like peptidoglycan-associated protein